MAVGPGNVCRIVFLAMQALQAMNMPLATAPNSAARLSKPSSSSTAQENTEQCSSARYLYGEVSSSSSSGEHPASNALDVTNADDPWNFWQASPGLPQWIQFDLKKGADPISLCRYSLGAREQAEFAGDDMPTEWVLWGTAVGGDKLELDRQVVTDWKPSQSRSFGLALEQRSVQISGLRLEVLQNKGRPAQNGVPAQHIVVVADLAFFPVLAALNGANPGGNVDCVTTEWVSGACSASCGEGTVISTRQILTKPSGEGLPCGPLQKSDFCQLRQCEVDCVVGDWSPSQCSTSCGDGVLTETRPILVPSANGGAICPPTARKQPCKQQPCPEVRDCVVSEWTDGPCSASCGDGIRIRSRRVTSQPENGGLGCPSELSVQLACSEAPCPVDCKLGDWQEGECSVTCGQGTATKTRAVTRAVQFGGRKCDGPLEQTTVCSLAPCPIDCQVSDWDDSACSVSCGKGVIKSVRKIVRQAEHGGEACPAELEQEAPCQIKRCPVDCKVSEWSSGPCSKSCGGGERILQRAILKKEEHAGHKCPRPNELRKVEKCNLEACPVDCQVSLWKAGPCSSSCGNGTVTSTRTVTKQAEAGGQPCPTPLTRLDACFLRSCAVDCVVSEWKSSPCSVSCGRGVMTATRKVIKKGENGGKSCPSLLRTDPCDLRPCNEPKDCKLSEWVVTKACSEACGDGFVVMSRIILAPPEHGGAACPAKAALEKRTLCNLGPCQHADCILTQWENGPCSTSCGPGVAFASRKVLVAGASGGLLCPSDPEQYQKSVPCLVGVCGKMSSAVGLQGADKATALALEKRISQLENQNTNALAKERVPHQAATKEVGQECCEK